MGRVPDVVCGQHWRDKMILWPRGVNLPQAGILKNIFFWSNGSQLQTDILQIPTHGQAFEIMEFGSSLMAEVYSNPYGLPWEREDQHSISALNDFASCSQTGKVFGETIGTHHMVDRGDHSIIDKSEQARDVLKSVLQDFMRRSRQPVLVHSSDMIVSKPQKQQAPLALAAPAAQPVAALA